MSRDFDNRDHLEMNAYLHERVEFLKGQIDFLNNYIRNLEGLVEADAATITRLLEELQQARMS